MSSPPSPKRLKTSAVATKQQQASLTSFFGAPKAAAPSKTTISVAKSNDVETTEKASSSDKASTAVSTTSTHAIIPQVVPWSESKWKVHEMAVIYRQAGPKRSKVAAFDMDGTLLVWRTSGWPSKLTDYELWNNAVIPKLRQLYDDENYQLILISNQGAIRGAFTGKKATTVKSLVEWLVATIDRPVSVVMSTDKKKGFHKPSVALWQAAQKLLAPNNPWSISESFFVGDSIGGDDDPQGGVDICLARNVSKLMGETLRFYPPEDYFGISSAQQRQATVTVESAPPHALTARAALCSGNLSSGPLLLLLCGAQGSGKSTVAQRIVEQNPKQWVHYSQDTIRDGKPGKREDVEKAVKQALAEQRCVIVDRMHLDPSQRKIFVELVRDLDVPVHAVVLTPPTAVIQQRVKDRTNHAGNVEGESGARMAKASAGKLVFPTYDEGFSLISGSSSPDVGVNRIVNMYQRIGSTEPSKVPTDFPLTCIQETPVTLPSIVLGTMGMGRRTADQSVKGALGVGLRGVDTAPTYKNEDKVGDVLSKDTFVVVKVPKRATAAEEVHKELQTSLQNLQRTQADLLLLHWPSLPPDSLKEIWQAMENAVKEGKAKALGVCNANVAAMAGLLPLCRTPPVVVQLERHPLLPQWDVIDFCAQHDIQVQAHTALGQGETEVLEHPVVQQVASGHGEYSAAQVILAWNLQQGVAVVPKASTKEHLEELMRIPQLSPKDLQLLNDITDRKRLVAPPFMYGSAPYCWGKQLPK
eukprot:scaffold7349_cov173-Amphora_coffeaeformis.AAC.80